MKKAALLLALLLLFSFTGCEQNGGGGSFQYYLSAGIKSLDPQTATGEAAGIAVTSLFEGLCRLDSTGRATPGAAESWESNAAFTSYTFTLRENAMWSDGTPLTAQDFVYGWSRAVAPDTKATNLEDLFTLKNAKRINEGQEETRNLGVSAPDGRTLVVELERPMENFPEMTAGPRFMPCSQAFFSATAGRYGLQKRYLLTNGPFVLSGSSDWSRELSLVRSTAYRGQSAVRPDSLLLSAGLDSKAAADPVGALLNGDADILPLSFDESVLAAAGGANITALKDRVTGLIFNTKDSALQHKELRELFVKSLDRQSILSALPEDMEAAERMVPDNIRWQDSAYYDTANNASPMIPEDKDAAAGLGPILKQLDLDTVPSVTVICPNDPVSIALANKVIISWNGRMGSYFNIQPLDAADYESRMAAGDYQAALCTVTAQGNTPYSYFKNFESTGSPKLLAAEDFDAMLRGANKSYTEYEAMEQYLQQQAIFYPIHKEKSYYGVGPKIRGLILTTGHLDFIRAQK